MARVTPGKSPKFYIDIHKDLSPAEAVFTLVHEWAHCMTFGYPGEQSDAVWAVAYAELYQFAFGDH